MLYRLEIENFHSIRDKQVIDLRLPSRSHAWPERFAPIFKGAKTIAPKVIALFGPNASGKSNILRALAFLAWFLKGSFHYTKSGFPLTRFQDEGAAKLPVRLAIELGGRTELSTNPKMHQESVRFGLYRYELELLPHSGFVDTVGFEALWHKPDGTGKWKRVFERRSGDTLLGSKTFPLSGLQQITDTIRSDASVVATLALFNHEPSKFIQMTADSIISNLLIERVEPTDREVFEFLASNSELFIALNKEIRRIDLGVDNISIVISSAGPTLMFKHAGLDVEMPWHTESHGTRMFVKIFPWIFMAMQKGGIALIDELDLAIHPLILPEVLRWFYDPVRNPSNAQLWMTCHSTSLMDDLVKEEIVLTEKDRQGRTKAYSLMDMEGLRRDDNLYRKYMGGVYGAVPGIG